jgi:hypothetical protein
MRATGGSKGYWAPRWPSLRKRHKCDIRMWHARPLITLAAVLAILLPPDGPGHAGGDHDRIRNLQRTLFTLYEHPVQRTCRSRGLLRQRFVRGVTEDLLLPKGLDGETVPLGLE